MKRRTLLQMFAAASVLGGCAELGIGTGPSRPPVTGRVIVGNGQGGPGAAGSGRTTITVEEARRIAVQNGLTGYKALPPGIQRNLARGKRIPPGIERRMVPGGMLNQLPVIEGHEWRVAGSDLILVAIATLIVAQVLNDVFS